MLASAFFRRAASRSSRASRAFRAVASRRSAAGSIRRVVVEVSADPTMEVAADFSRESGALDQGKRSEETQTRSTRKEKVREEDSTYSETSCGSFTALRKWMAFAAASSRLVAAAEPLGFFGRLRSEEHTSELQSLRLTSYAVFCLKKKKRRPPQLERKKRQWKNNPAETHHGRIAPHRRSDGACRLHLRLSGPRILPRP